MNVVEPEVGAAGDEGSSANGDKTMDLRGMLSEISGPREAEPKVNIPPLFQG